MDPKELIEFAAALALAVEFLATEYPDDPQLLDWVSEVLRDAIECHSLDQRQGDQLRSELWQRLKPTTREALQRLRQRQEAA